MLNFSLVDNRNKQYVLDMIRCTVSWKKEKRTNNNWSVTGPYKSLLARYRYWLVPGMLVLARASTVVTGSFRICVLVYGHK